jgi:hypothetical protein
MLSTLTTLHNTLDRPRDICYLLAHEQYFFERLAPERA